MEDVKNNLSEKLRVYAVTDRGILKNGMTVVDAAEKAARGGATMVQLREKGLGTEELTDRAKVLRIRLEKYGVPLIVDDDPQAARDADAAGVHIGQDDTDPAEARAVIGPDRILGITAHSVKEAVEAEKAGADYIGAGAVFETSSKSDTTPLSKEELGRICDAVDIPVVAIGGVNSGNLGVLKGTGIAGAAAISAFFGGESIQDSAARMADAVHRMLGSDKYKAAVFDYDGTVLDSMPMWETVPSRFARMLGAEAEPGLDERVKYMTLEESSAKFREYGAKGTDEEIIDQIMDMVWYSYKNELEMKPGLLDIFEEFKSAGIRMAVATQTPSRMIYSANKRLGIDKYFDGIFSCADWATTKHEPDIYYIAAASLGAAPCETLVFEDMIYAAATAHDAGFTVVGVYDKSSECDRPSIERSSRIYLESYADWPGIENIKREDV
ncbi:MAG: thiamine phosphate synthase [Anaerovoracaceae bacterium]|jgi:thiamine-phosphate diphosphorylase